MLGILVLLGIVLVAMALVGGLLYSGRQSDSRSRPVGWRVGLVIGGAGILAMIAAMLFVVGDETVHEQSSVEVVETARSVLEYKYSRERSVRSVLLGQARSPLDVPFVAEVYPTQTLAAEALGELLLYRLSLRLIDPADAEVETVEQVVVEGPAPEAVRDILAEALAEHPSIKAVHRADSGFSGAPDVRVTVDSRQQDGQTVLRARAELDLDRPLEPVAAEIAWVDKPWAAHFEIWRQQRAEAEPGVGYLQLHSGTPVPEIEQAEQSNLEMLSAGLLEPVRNEIRRLIAAGQLGERADADRSVQQEALQKALAEMRSSWQADRFVQRFQRDYAELVSVDVLVRLRQEFVEKLAMQTGRLVEAEARLARADRARRVTGQVRLYLAAAALVLAVAMLYLVANAATKGYYLWRLRLASAACIAAGLVLLVRFLQP
jgi:hypothetical protein